MADLTSLAMDNEKTERSGKIMKFYIEKKEENTVKSLQEKGEMLQDPKLIEEKKL